MPEIVVPEAPPRGLDALARLQLRVEVGGEDVGGYVAGPDVHPGVLVDQSPKEPAAVRALLADDLRPLGEARVVDEQRAALAAVDVLGLVEALRREAAEGAERPAPVRAEEPVRVVLDDRDPVT